MKYGGLEPWIDEYLRGIMRIPANPYEFMVENDVLNATGTIVAYTHRNLYVFLLFDITNLAFKDGLNEFSDPLGLPYDSPRVHRAESCYGFI
jgi:hypothetical protein